MAKILITGASTGIGAEAARVLAPGNELFLVYNRSVDAAKALAAETNAAGATTHLLQSDITSEIACIDLFRQIGALTESLDVLINNAGGLVRRQAVDALEWNLMEEIYALNVFSVRTSAPRTPMKPSGTVNITVNGCTNDSNCEAMIM